MLARARSTEGFITGLFIQWLYIDAPSTYFGYIQELIFGLFEYFSISLMFRTLISPFRHDSVDMTRIPVRLWFQAITTNLVSRAIGFVLRLGVIFTGMVSICVVGVGSVLFMIGWYLLPLLLVASIVYGVTLAAGGSV